MEDHYTRTVSNFASSVRFADLPDGVVEHAKVCLLDALGCALFCSTLPWVRMVADTVHEMEPGGLSTLWGMSAKASPAGAALVNSTMVHSFEIDDVHKTAILHPGPLVVPPALALAEHLGGVSGERFLTAMVAGYEVVIRAGMCLGMAHLVHGWMPTGTCGPLGAAAACGSLLGLPPDRMQHALGVAGAQACGLMAVQYSSMMKRMASGRAAQTGVYAALLASRGFTGITRLFESEYGGFCSTLSPSYDRDKLVDGLGQVWETSNVGFKPYSTIASAHTTIDAVLDLRRHYDFRPEDVESVKVFSSTATEKHTGWPYLPESATTAQMNLPFIVAAAIADGDVFVDQFTEERIRSEPLVEFARRVRVVADPDIDAQGDEYRWAVRVEVVLKDGRVLRDARRDPKGSAAFPVGRDEIEAKFRRLAGKRLPAERVRQLEDLVHDVDRLEDVRSLTEALVIDPA